MMGSLSPYAVNSLFVCLVFFVVYSECSFSVPFVSPWFL